MRFLSRAASVALLLGAMLPAAPAQNPQKQATGVITGRVTQGEKAMANVSVALMPAEERPERRSVAKATTDFEGRYRLSNVAAGRYNVVAIVPAFVGPSDGMYGEPGKVVTISEGETVEKIDFSLTRGGVITGRVTDADGAPVVGERVQLNQQQQQGQSRARNFSNFNPFMFETDDRGVYRIYGITPGRYTVSIGDSGETGSVRFGFGGRGYYKRTFHPGVTEEARATVIEIGEGTEASNVDIVAGSKSKSFVATGRVTDESGKPVSGARIGNGAVLKDGKRMGGFGYGTLSDTNGGFRLDGLMPGRYAAFVWSEGDIDGYSEAVPFEITDGNISGLELKIRRGASITGVAVIEGTTDRAALAKMAQLSLAANVEIDGLAAPTFSNVRLAPDGSFRITGLRPGKARLHLSTYPPIPGFALARVEREGVAQREIEIAPGAQVTGIRVVIEYGTGAVRGVVKVEGGQLPENARMIVSARRRGDAAASPSSRGAQVDARGRFLIEGMPSGEYELTLQAYIPGAQRRFTPTRQNVTVINGTEAEVTLVFDPNSKEPEGGNNE
jgi:protocatechuate 3,4-dioxygenase beta subunit